jgi:flagellar motor switch protein FliM
LSETLTKVEVEALIKSIGEGEIELESIDPSFFRDYVPYDFSKPHSLSTVFSGNLATVSDSFAKAASLTFSRFYRSTVSVLPRGLNHILFQEFVGTRSNPSCMAIINLPPLKGQSILELDHRIIFSLVDKLMGGEGKVVDENREFTEIELRVSRKVVGKLLGDMVDGFNRFVQIKSSLSRVENNPDFVNIVHDMDRVVVLELSVQIGEFSGMMYLCIPVSAFEPVIDQFDPEEEKPKRSREERGQDIRKLMETLDEMELDVQVQIGRAEIPLNKARSLKIGDTIVLDKKASTPVDVMVEGLPKFMGIPGHYKEKKAVRIVSKVQGG